MSKFKTIKYENVDITSPHILVSFSDQYGCVDWKPIAILSLPRSIDNMRLALLLNGIDDTILDMMHRELNFYLFELKNPSNIEYLIYHCSTMSNIYSNIHFTHVPEINKNNFLYYIKTQSKLMGIFHNSFISDIQECYLQLVVNQLFDKALNNASPDAVENYNIDLNYFYRLIFIVLGENEGFTINDKFNLVEFAQYISRLTIKDFSIILNYLRYTKIVKNTGVMRLLKFYHTNLIHKNE